jgi:ABC-2 type transport system permease protein
VSGAEHTGAPPLRDISGPGALGGSWRRFVHLTWLIASTEFRLTYFGSALGYLWSLMRPLMLFGVLYVVFSQIVKFGDDIVNYPVLLLLNVVCFNFFQEATGIAVTSVVQRESLVRKMHFPRLVIPLSVVLTAALNLAVNLVAVLGFILIYGVDVHWSWLLLPVGLIPLVVFALAVSMLLSSLYVRFRDVAPIWTVLSTALFYGTPVLYAVEKAEDATQYLLYNPIAVILEQLRHWIIDPGSPGAVEAIGGWGPFMIPVAVFVGTCALAAWVFHREAPRIAESL